MNDLTPPQRLFAVWAFTFLTLMLAAGARPSASILNFPTTPSPSVSDAVTVNLLDYGTAGDGAEDDGPALQSALDALGAAGGGTLFVPEGRYAIVTPVRKDFTGLASAITIRGVESPTVVTTTGNGRELTRPLDLVSEFYPRTGGQQVALSIQGLQHLQVRDIGFVGTPGVPNDAYITLELTDVEDAAITHCEFYGLHTFNGAIVLARRSGLKIEQTKFLGSFGNSGTYTPVVQNL